MNSILLAGFSGTSAQYLVEQSKECDALLLPNDKVLDSQLLISKLQNNKYDIVVAIGQKPNLKNKVCIEVTARCGENALESTLDCKVLVQCFSKFGLQAKLSFNAGTSFCNALYYNVLRHNEDHKKMVGMVFVHIPFIKNISDPKAFSESFFQCLYQLKNTEAEKLWKNWRY